MSISSRLQIASSLIAWWVPSAIITSSAWVAPPICSNIAWNSIPSGQVRVASGTMSSTRLSL